MATETPARNLWSSLASPTATARHGTDECHLKRPSYKPYVHRNKTKLLSDTRNAPTRRRQVCDICRCCHWHCRLRLSRHACADRPMVEKLETFLTICDDDDGKFTKCCYDDVLYRREQYSRVIVYVREQCCHTDTERVAPNDRWKWRREIHRVLPWWQLHSL